MALKPCKSCNHQIDANAETCPSCGAAFPGVTGKDRLHMLVGLAAVIAVTVWACSGESTPQGLKVSEADFGAAWPLTVPAAELLCEGPPPAALAKVDGKLYALNGSARTVAAEKGWLDGVALIKPNPEVPGIPMDVSPLVERAQVLCRAE